MLHSAARAKAAGAASLGLLVFVGGCGIGAQCGGLTGAACVDGLYCQFEEGTCGAADQTGLCLPIPQICTEQFEPVCGCDDQTYDNECFAAAAGVSIVSRGACAGGGPGIVVGEGDDDGDTEGEAEFCGGIAGFPCPDGQYCQYELGTCGAADQGGTCQSMPSVCTEIFAPVCGCDGETYGNDCFAAVAGVSVQATGACP